MLYGFLLYVFTTAVMVFAYSNTTYTPPLLPALWDLGALLILVGAYGFFFFLRVNVVYDGDSPFHAGRSDLFVLSLIGSAAFGLLWHGFQATHSDTVSLVLFAIYIFFTTVLFGPVFWSKFAHMFYKPVVAFQRRVDEANGSSALPSTSAAHTEGSSGMPTYTDMTQCDGRGECVEKKWGLMGSPSAGSRGLSQVT